MNPEYAADLLAKSGRGAGAEAEAFIAGKEAPDAVAEELAEGFVHKVTHAQDGGQELLDSTSPEEQGGPFVETSAATEFASGTDESNIEGALREPFPTT